MKLGCLVVTALCVTGAAARADSSLIDRAAASSRAGDHARAAAEYRDAYAAQADPPLLVRIAHEYRLAGDSRDALEYFCSYIYADASGELADEASQNARELSASLGNPVQSDHDACSAPPAPRPATTASLQAPMPPPRITKREIAGLTLIGGSITSLGFALLEGRTLTQIAKDSVVAHTDEELASLADRKRDASLRQKLLLGAGGAAFIGGVTLYLLGHADRKRAERAYVAPTLTKSGGGLVLGGKF